jgi:DNA polymerase III sliding clamp (beta) subunit (PCNA family)
MATATTLTSVTLEASVLKDGVAFVSKVSAKAMSPQYSVVLLDIKDKTATLRGTDGVRVRTVTLGQIDTGDCKVGLPIGPLSGIVTRLKDGVVSLAFEDDKVTITSGNRRYDLRIADVVLPADVTVPADAASLTLPGGLLSDLLRRTSKSVGQDVAKPTAGVSLACNGTHLRAASTDSYRLSYAVVPVTTGAELTALIPGSMAAETASAAANAASVSLTVVNDGGGQVLVSYGDRTETLPQLAGSFPEFSAMLEVSATTTLSIDDPSMVVEEIKAIEPVAKRSALGAIVTVIVADKAVTLSGDDEAGDAAITLPLGVEGRAVKAAFNSAFLADALASAGHRQVTLKLQGDTKPALVDGGTVDGVTFKALVMPTRM